MTPCSRWRSVSPDGSLIASGGNDKIVRIWKRSTREQTWTIPVKTFVYSVCFSPEGDLLAIGDNDGNVYLWNCFDKSLTSYQPGGRVTDLAFDAKGKHLISVGFDIHVYDLERRSVQAKTFADSAQAGAITLSPDGKLIVGTAKSMAANETFKVPKAWTLDGAELIGKDDLFSEAMGHRSFIDAVAFSPDGTLLAASSQSAVRLWDVKKKRAVGAKLCGHTYSLNDLKFSPDGKWLASASWDGTARIWEIPSGRQAVLLDADVYRISCIDFTSEGHLVTANWDGTIHLWEWSKLMAQSAD